MSAAARRSPEAQARLLAAEPQLFVTDLEGALGFYVNRLSFAVAFAYGEPPFYAQVARDGAALNLRLARGPLRGAEYRAREPDALACTLTVDDSAALFEEFKATGVDFHQRLRTEPWGAQTFIVADPDGNLLAFAGD